MKLDILAFAAHPDDVELSCAGTILRHVSKGYKVGIIDLTTGQLGTRGTPRIRITEAEAASKLMGLTVRENLGLEDGFFTEDTPTCLKVVEKIRKYTPSIVLANAISDRHPDHARAARLVSKACFLAGLRKIETVENGNLQEAYRPKNVYHYIQDRSLTPDITVDISEFWEEKIKVIRAFKSQFFDPKNTEPETYISDPAFLKFIEARAREAGHAVGVTFGEGFTTEKKLGTGDLFSLI